MTQRIRVAGLVRKDDDFLLIQQEDRSGKLHWSLPGGRLEASDADMFRGVEREVLEETGLRVDAGRLLFLSEYSGPDMFALTLIFECHLAEGEDPANIHLNNTMEDDNIHEVAWWHVSQIQTADSGMSRTLGNMEFWQALETAGSVVHLGRHDDGD
jgi:ADP-ribose pyrophosphatase YjhB (NUDIX family)